MEVVYEGPRSLFNDFGDAVCDAAGVDTYTVDYTKKGWAVEIIRSIVQFDPEEARAEGEILRFLVNWATNQAASITVHLKGPGDNRMGRPAKVITDRRKT
jgi:hypothetical protein